MSRVGLLSLVFFPFKTASRLWSKIPPSMARTGRWKPKLKNLKPKETKENSDHLLQLCDCLALCAVKHQINPSFCSCHLVWLLLEGCLGLSVYFSSGRFLRWVITPYQRLACRLQSLWLTWKCFKAPEGKTYFFFFSTFCPNLVTHVFFYFDFSIKQ